MLKRKAIGLACLLALTSALNAQNITGSMTGRVVDQQGGTVVNAVVTVTDQGRKTPTTQRTNSGGEFTLAALPPGN